MTGFDPLRDQILEIGFVFFRPTPGGLEVVERWSQVFKPTMDVHPKILGLTGITMAELEQAPPLAEFHQFLREKLGSATIVGHNVVLDRRFLEAFGIPLAGPTIDTLDLVQFILPTHHSYNLENLMHYFNVKHEEAHRALGDALATVNLLEQLLRRYQAFSKELQDKILAIAAQQGFFWQELLGYPFNFPVPDPVPGQSSPLAETEGEEGSLAGQSFILRPFREITPAPIARLLQKGQEPYLLAVPDKNQVLQLWKDGLVHGLFSPEDCFDRKKFDHLLSLEMDPEQARFCLKILVWSYTNWQTETVIDLNLSFAGGQFRSLVTGKFPGGEIGPDQLLCCDYQTFGLLAQRKLHSGHRPVLWTAHALEQWLSEGSQGRLTWNQILYYLKTIYNPETGFGQESLREPVVEALAAADLFFGLVNLLLGRYYGGEARVSYESLAQNPHVFGQIQTAAQSFTAKINTVQDRHGFLELKRFAESLNAFFADAPGQVKWIEAGETNCAFISRPLDIAPILQGLLKNFPPAVAVDNIPHEGLLRYILQRLGLDFPENFIPAAAEKPVEGRLVPSGSDIAALLQPEHLPAVLLFTHPSEVRDFYDRNYSRLKAFARVFAQGYSGGSNKILRNFMISDASVLIATGNFIVRNGRPVQAKTLLVHGVPELDQSHPYLHALQNHWQGKFPAFMELQETLRLNLLAQLLYSPALERVYLFSPTVARLMARSPFFLIK